MPLNTLPQFEGVSIRILVIIIFFSQRGNDFVVLVMTHKTVKDQQIYLTVLIYRRIDPCVVIAGVDYGVFRIGLYISALFFIITARSHHHSHGQYQQRSYQQFSFML